MGPRQFSAIDDEVTLKCLGWLLGQLPPGLGIFSGSDQRFRNMLQQVLEDLGLGDVGFTVGSLRGEVATHRYILTWNVPALRLLGWWSNERSLEIYLQEATAALIVSQLDESETAVEAARSVLPHLSEAPQAPWAHCFLRRAQLAALLRVARRRIEEQLRFDSLGPPL